jgi:hypothetical protein
MQDQICYEVIRLKKCFFKKKKLLNLIWLLSVKTLDLIIFNKFTQNFP